MPAVKDFRDFALKSNFLDLAVAVVVGAALATLVRSFVTNILTPAIAAVGGYPDISSLELRLGGAVFRYGAFLTALIAFVMTLAVVFFLLVRPVQRLRARSARKEAESARECPYCLTKIPKAAKRCAACCSALEPAP